MLGALIVLYWLYMGSQSRFYARWMLPLYPALAILAAYAISLVRQRVVFGALVALMLLPSRLSRRSATRSCMGREDTRSETRDWLVANVPAGTKVAFEPIAPTEWYGVTPGGGAKADPRQQWQRFNRIAGDRSPSSRRRYRGALRPANFQNYERTLTPALLDIYRREGVCWHVTGSTQYGRAQAEPQRAPEAMRFYRALQARRPTSCSRPPRPTATAALPGRQVVQLRRRRVRPARAAR